MDLKLSTLGKMMKENKATFPDIPDKKNITWFCTLSESMVCVKAYFLGFPRWLHLGLYYCIDKKIEINNLFIKIFVTQKT